MVSFISYDSNTMMALLYSVLIQLNAIRHIIKITSDTHTLKSSVFLSLCCMKPSAHYF